MKQRSDSVQDWVKIRSMAHKVNLDSRYVLAFILMVRDGQLKPPEEKYLLEAEKVLDAVSPR